MAGLFYFSAFLSVLSNMAFPNGRSRLAEAAEKCRVETGLAPSPGRPRAVLEHEREGRGFHSLRKNSTSPRTGRFFPNCSAVPPTPT